MRVAVVDLDDTLLISARISYFLWSISLFFQKLGRTLQKGNLELFEQLKEYDQVIVLTARDVKDLRFTERQLSKGGLRVDQIICCPRKHVLTQWKLSVVRDQLCSEKIDWIDDVFDEELDPEFSSSLAGKVRVSGPSALSKRRRDPTHDSELERL